MRYMWGSKVNSDETPASSSDCGAARPRLLFLSQTLPFPPDGGVNLRTFNILRQLAKSFQVTALCFFRKGHRMTRNDVEASVVGLSQYAEVFAFEIPQEHRRWRLTYDHARSVITRRAYTHYLHDSLAFQDRLA